LAQTARPSSEARGRLVHFSALHHAFQLRNGFHRSDQHSFCPARWSSHNIEQMVDAVAQVYISVASAPEHGLRPARAPVAVGMAGFVLGGSIGFYFNNPANAAFALQVGYQMLPQKPTAEGKYVNFGEKGSL